MSVKNQVIFSFLYEELSLNSLQSDYIYFTYMLQLNFLFCVEKVHVIFDIQGPALQNLLLQNHKHGIL